jgi:hypothetical protein
MYSSSSDLSCNLSSLSLYPPTFLPLPSPYLSLRNLDHDRDHGFDVDVDAATALSTCLSSHRSRYRSMAKASDDRANGDAADDARNLSDWVVRSMSVRGGGERGGIVAPALGLGFVRTGAGSGWVVGRVVVAFVDFDVDLGEGGRVVGRAAVAVFRSMGRWASAVDRASLEVGRRVFGIVVRVGIAGAARLVGRRRGFGVGLGSIHGLSLRGCVLLCKLFESKDGLWARWRV